MPWLSKWWRWLVGGSSKKVTVGYKYHLGMHMVLCHGPIDFVSAVRIDDRLAWAGYSEGGRLVINKPGLFGGEDREGGVSGNVDIDMGGPTQLPNTYLQQQLGTDIPGFRGVVSAVLRQVYLGMNPYLKPWAFRATRLLTTSDGEEMWYRERANIASEPPVLFSNDLAFPANAASSTEDGDPVAAIEITGIDPTDIVTLAKPVGLTYKAWSAWDTDGATGAEGKPWSNRFEVTDGTGRRVTYWSEWFATADEAEQWANDQGQIFLTGSDYYKIWLADTPPGDNRGGLSLRVVKAGAGDMNPAHIIRECLTDSTWGMGYLPADIDNVSFTASADALFNEQMGISLLWDRQIPIEEFVGEIVRHINATLYVDKFSGKFTLKLIRYDYDIETVPVLDESNITDISDYSRVDPGDAINSVSVVYWDAGTGENASVTADDPALIQAYGTVVNTTVQYPGFTNRRLASRAAARDLQTLSSPLLSCSIEATREAADLNIGDVFKLVWPKYHDGYVLMRVHMISFGDGKKNRVKIKASEDIFALPDESLLGVEESGDVGIGGPPLPPPVQIVEEAPYLELVQQMGQTQIDGLLSDTPEIGYLQVAATRPDYGLNAQIWVDDGSGYEDGGPLDFAPTAKLASAVNRVEQNWTLTAGEDLDQVQIGTHAQIGEELLRVDAVDEVAGTLTVGRAILDTVPSPHSAGDVIVFWDLYSGSDLTEYVAGESLDVRVLTNSSEGALELPQGVTDTLVMDQRAFRPFRPAALKADGFLEPDPSYYPPYPVDITWVERNRTQETSGVFLSWEEPTVTPEPATDYIITVEAIDENDAVAGQVTQVTQSSLSYSLTAETIGSTWAAYPFIRVSVKSRRDGVLESWKAPYVQFRGPFREPDQLISIYRKPRAPVDVTGTNITY